MKAARIAGAGIAAVVLAGILSAEPQQPSGAGRLQLEPLGARFEAVFPYFEGWYRNDDGTATIVLGYFNRNTDQILDVPIGADNRIEPGGPDRGQPTHFLPRRQYGIFSITVPKDFGNQKITWTLTANKLTNSVTVWLNPLYFVEPFKNIANGNTPPTISFSENGPFLQGPPRATAQTVKATTNQPVTLRLWVRDLPSTYDAVANRYLTLEEVAANHARSAVEQGPAASGRGADGGRGTAGRAAEPPAIAVVGGQVIARADPGAARGRGGATPADVTIHWTKYRGPGEVRFASDRISLQLKGNFTSSRLAETTATFSAPGTYTLRAVANDSSGDGGGGNQCCWTTAHVQVNIE